MELAEPRWLWAMLLLVPYGWLRWRVVRASAVPFAPLQYRRGPRWRAVLLRVLVLGEVLLLAAAVVAMARPLRVDRVDSITEEGLDLALVLDISASMQAADFPPNRLEALKELSRDLLYRGGGNRIGVYAFAKHVFTQTPLTTDHQALVSLVDDLAYESINHAESGGTALGDALLVAVDALVASRVEGRDQVVVLISDGESNAGSDPMLAARYLLDSGVRLHVIGLGGDEEVEVLVHGKPFINSEDQVLTTSLDDAQLRQIAAAAGGLYHRAGTLDVLREVFDGLSRLERTPVEVRQVRVERSWAPHLALLMLLGYGTWLMTTVVAVRRPLR